ncbi:hypothetical protein A1D31_27835 [Bradyrhizobium liaoningense]|nr:hypothetical protein A1D31_27835 [Bradyrhizobium liaoningense]
MGSKPRSIASLDGVSSALLFQRLGGCINYIFPLLAITIGLFVLYAMVRPSLRRIRPADAVHWPDSSLSEAPQ